MIICDQCGCRVKSEDRASVPTREDPYGEDNDWCKNCYLKLQDIHAEVAIRLREIKERAVKRRFDKWKSSFIEIKEEE